MEIVSFYIGQKGRQFLKRFTENLLANNITTTKYNYAHHLIYNIHILAPTSNLYTYVIKADIWTPLTILKYTGLLKRIKIIC